MFQPGDVRIRDRRALQRESGDLSGHFSRDVPEGFRRGRIRLTDDDRLAQIAVRRDARIDRDLAQEIDSELRGDAFFNSTKFPQARYTATKFRALGGNKYAADGILSLRGASKPVTLTFTWTPGATPVLAGKATVKRLAFGVGGEGDWADTELFPDAIAISTRVVLQPAK